MFLSLQRVCQLSGHMPLTSTTTIGSTRTRAQRSGQGVGVGLSVSCRSFGTGSDRLMKHTADSLIQLHLPLHDDLNLRSNMINHFGGLKFGSILEKLDLAAGAAAYKHVLGIDLSTPILEERGKLRLNGAPTIVTASCESIIVYEPPSIDQNLVIEGRVVSAGRSSMDVHLKLVSLTSKQVLTEAEFTMVAREADLDTGKSRPYVVPGLILETEEDKKNYDRASAKREVRQKRAQENLMKVPPTSDERLEIHELIYVKSSIDSTKKWIDMSDTKKQSIVVMQPQEHSQQNFRRLFDEAFELAWANAYLFTDQIPNIRAVHDQTFYLPVEIGSVCSFNSTVTFTNHTSVHVEVRTDIEDPISNIPKTSNYFYFTFNVQSRMTNHVMPRLYEEAMKYIESKRRMAYLSR